MNVEGIFSIRLTTPIAVHYASALIKPVLLGLISSTGEHATNESVSNLEL